LNTVVRTLLKAFLVPDLDVSKIPGCWTICTIVSCVYTDFVVTIEVLVEVLGDINRDFIEARFLV